ncbi:MAG: hypothetical protein M0Z55_11910 [Peptococcaceae bacterium]|nr:hypothetical protein [Peptococcaceae bacterium]
MRHNKYKYESKGLLRDGLLFLILFPLVMGGGAWALGLTNHSVVFGLSAIYLVDLLLLAWLFLVTWDKTVMIGDKAMGFSSRLFYQEYIPRDITQITLLANQKGREFLRIRTNNKYYYLDDQYQPWESLLTDVERFAKECNIASNLVD